MCYSINHVLSYFHLSRGLLMNINYVEYTLILDSLKAYLDDDNDEYYNTDIKSLINKLESNETV